MSDDEEQVSLLYNSRTIRMIEKSTLIDGKLQISLDDEEAKNVLLSKQRGDVLALVTRFNTVSYYSCFTGNLIYKMILPNNHQIQDAYKYKRHDDL